MEQVTEQNKYQDYIGMFNRLFETNVKSIDFKRLELLNTIFRRFDEELYTPSPKYKEMRRNFMKFSDELNNTLTKEQKELFENSLDINNMMNEEIEEQLFMFGVILGNKLRIEMN